MTRETTVVAAVATTHHADKAITMTPGVRNSLGSGDAEQLDDSRPSRRGPTHATPTRAVKRGWLGTSAARSTSRKIITRSEMISKW